MNNNMKVKVEITYIYIHMKRNASYYIMRCFLMGYSDRELIARLIQCEAGGEGDNGMKAVATVF